MIVVVDSGGANLVSVISSLTRLGAEVKVSTSPCDIEQASHVILPGVGSAQNIMNRLRDLKLTTVLRTVTKPVLGICVGMQILFEFSEEQQTPGLGVMEGRIEKLPKMPGLSLPHIGWNTLQILTPTPIMANLSTSPYVYFVHGYAAPISAYTIAETEYGQSFSAAVRHRNFWGVQFHPERSGEMGSLILKNFLECSDDYLSSN